MSLQVHEKVIILPAVDLAHHGTGLANTVRSILDQNGRLVWEKSPRGFISHFIYDDANGAVKRRIEDVDVSRTSDFNGSVPDGWTAPPVGGTHLITDIITDPNGRTLESQGPVHAVQTGEPNGSVPQPRALRTCQFFAFDDPQNVQLSAIGYREGAAGTNPPHTVGALNWARSDAAGRVVEERLIERPAAVDSWPPTASEGMSDRSRWRRWLTAGCNWPTFRSRLRRSGGPREGPGPGRMDATEPLGAHYCSWARSGARAQ
jgi:hypothetical protein